MEIKLAKFIASNQDVFKCPDINIPEYAFIGRSNVGKSSLINMITNKKKLAKISGQPGKTKLINHFLMDNKWFLVDLPGYGYAKASKQTKNLFKKYIKSYFTHRKQLVCAFVLIDIRHDPLKIDIEFMEWLTRTQNAFNIIFTKSDKINVNEIEKKIKNYKKVFGEKWEKFPKYFITSSKKSIGKENLLTYINLINESVIK